MSDEKSNTIPAPVATKEREEKPVQPVESDEMTWKPEFTEKQLKEQERAIRLERNGERYQEYRKLDEALESFRDAARIFRRINDLDGLGRITFHQGECLETQEKYSDAAAMYKESKGHFEKMGDKRRIGIASDRLAKTHYWKGSVIEAIAEYEDAIEKGTQTSEVFNNQAFLLIENDDLEKAHQRLEKALELRRAEESAETHITLNNLGVLDYLKGNHQKAYDLFDEGIKTDMRVPEEDRSIQFMVFYKPEFKDEKFANYRVFKDVNTKVCLMMNKAAAAEVLGKTQEVDTLIEEGMDSERDYAYTQEAAGFIHLNRGDEKKALDHFKRAVPYDPANPDLKKVIGMINPYLNMKVGRNDPCPCGSGKKYKKCHGAPV